MSVAENVSTSRQSKANLRPVTMSTVETPREPRHHLRGILVGIDSIALALAWVPVFVIGYGSYDRRVYQSAAMAALMIFIGLWLIHIHELYLARISTVRAVEMSRVARIVVILGAVALSTSRILKINTSRTELLLGPLMTLIYLIIGRSAYRAWTTAARRSGRFLRDVILIGTNSEAKELRELMADHPEAGFRVVGVLGERDQAVANGMSSLWCGGFDEPVSALRSHRANGVIICVSSLGQDQLNELIRQVQSEQAHIHLSNGVRGTDYRRLRSVPIAHEPLLYLEAPMLEGRQVLAKRVVDLAVSILGLILMSIPIGIVALIIKLNDGGPVFFKQVRVGRDGQPFKVYKFRTMVVDAEKKLAALAATNERSGPLFKMERDPRVTRIGHFLRDSSLDELPQLINVVLGEMSLVGPRPALPSEVALFDHQLLNRTKVQPGITGLWQVEARDNPSFAAYRRLDLFYVDNWSVSLDLIIMLATVEQVVARFVTSALRRRNATKPTKVSIGLDLDGAPVPVRPPSTPA